MDIRLPNGTLVQNIPDGTTQEELRSTLINSGRVNASAFNPQTAEASILSIPKQIVEADDETHSHVLLKNYYSYKNGTELSDEAVANRVRADFGENASYTSAVRSLRNTYKIAQTDAHPMSLEINDKATFGDYMRALSGHTAKHVWHTASGGNKMIAGLVRNYSKNGENSPSYDFFMNMGDYQTEYGNDLYNVMSEKGMFDEVAHEDALNSVWTSGGGQLLSIIPVVAGAGLFGGSLSVLAGGTRASGSFIGGLSASVPINIGMYYNEAFSQAKDDGLSDGDAHDAAGIYTAVAAPTAVLSDLVIGGVFRPLRGIGGKLSSPALRVLAKTATQAALGSVTEGGQEGFEYVLLQKLLNKEIEPVEFWANARAGALLGALGSSITAFAQDVDAEVAKKRITQQIEPLFGEKSPEYAERIVESESPQETAQEVVEEHLADEIESMVETQEAPAKEGGDGDKYFDQTEIERASNQNPKSRETLVRMPIDDFLNMAEHLPVKDQTKEKTVSDLLSSETRFESLPYLRFENMGESVSIMSHEGRHRAMALKELGVKTIPVVVKSDTGDGPSIRWGEQDNPKSFDYVKDFPTMLETENGDMVPFPFSRSGEYKPTPQEAPAKEGEMPKIGENGVIKSKSEFLEPASTFTDKLFRQTNIERSLEFIDDRASGEIAGELFFSNNKDLALGQKENTGVLIEMRAPNDMMLRINKNLPGWDHHIEQGSAEFIAPFPTRKNLLDNVISFTVSPEAKGLPVFKKVLENIIKQRTSEGWTEIVNDDGSKTYVSPEIKPTPQEAPAKEGLDVFHGSRDESITSFDVEKGDIGVHFGTEEVATHRIGVQKGLGRRVYSRTITPKKTLRLPDISDWNVADQYLLAIRGKLEYGGKKYSDETGMTEAEKTFFESRVSSGDSAKVVRDTFLEMGYDSIIYRNEYEGKTESDSYIVLDKDIIREAKPTSQEAPAKEGAKDVAWVYHGTSEGAFRRIREEGLTGDKNYFADTEVYGESYATRKNGRLLRTKQTDTMVSDVSNDGGDYISTQAVSPKNIEVRVGDKWVQIQEYTDESANIMPIVAKPTSQEAPATRHAFTEVLTPQEAKHLGETLSDEDADLMYKPSEQQENFKKAIRGDAAALARYNEQVVNFDPAKPTQEIATIPAEDISYPAERILPFDRIRDEDLEILNTELNLRGEQAFNAEFGAILSLLTDDDVQSIFEKTLRDQLNQLKTEDLTAEQIQFLEMTEGVDLSSRAKSFYDRWHQIRPLLRDRIVHAAAITGDRFNPRGDYFFPLRKADRYMSEEEIDADWILQKEDLKFGSMVSRKKDVSPQVYNTDSLAVVKQYFQGLARLEHKAKIVELADKINVGELAEGLTLIKRYEGVAGLLSEEDQTKLKDAKQKIEAAEKVLRDADASGVTVNLQELDENQVFAMTDLYARVNQKDTNSSTEHVGLQALKFDNVENGFGGATEGVAIPTVEAVNNKNTALFTEEGILADLYRKHGMNPYSKSANEQLYAVSDKYGLDMLRKNPIEEFAAEDQQDVVFIKESLLFIEDLIERHNIDVKSRYELMRSDQQYWAEAFKTRAKQENYFNQMYAHLHKLINHAYISPAIRKINLYRQALRQVYREDGTRGFPKYNGYWKRYIEEALVGDISKLDSGMNIEVGSQAQKLMREWQGVRVRAHLVGNAGFMLGTQWTSGGLSISSSGPINFFRGLLLAAQPTTENMGDYGPFETMKRSDIYGPLYGATEVKDVSGSRLSFIEVFNEMLNKGATFVERYLTRASVIGMNYKAQQMGMKGERAALYADIIGAETQSNYRRETRGFIQNSDVLKMLSSHQTFAVTAMNHAKTIMGLGVPLSVKERMLRALWLAMSATVISAFMKWLTGRSYYTAGTFVPYAGDIIDAEINAFLAEHFKADEEIGKFLRKYGPVTRFAHYKETRPDLLRNFDNLFAGVYDLAEHKNPKRVYKWAASYGLATLGMGGGASYARIIDVLSAVAEGGEVQDVAGKKLFSIENDDAIKALIYGVYSTEEGREYISGLGRKKKKKQKAPWERKG